LTTSAATREALEAVAAHLDAAVAATVGATPSVVRGWVACASADADAQALRAAGAPWDWVALAIPPTSFWDLHVGVLAAPHAGGPTRLTVGLHWRPALDAVARPLALELAAAEAVHFARVSGEHQQALPLAPASPAETARAALNLAHHVLAVVSTTTAGTAPDAPQS
jgi:hypothetical protein